MPSGVARRLSPFAMIREEDRTASRGGPDEEEGGGEDASQQSTMHGGTAVVFEVQAAAAAQVDWTGRQAGLATAAAQAQVSVQTTGSEPL